MAHYRASESKREQFRRYLEKSGVLDTMTSVLVALYEETDKPNNALEMQLIDHLEKQKVSISPRKLCRKRLALQQIFGNSLRSNPVSDVTLMKELHLGAAGPEPADTEALHTELADLQKKCDLLMEENKELRNRLMQYEPSPGNGTEE